MVIVTATDYVTITPTAVAIKTPPSILSSFSTVTTSSRFSAGSSSPQIGQSLPAVSETPVGSLLPSPSDSIIPAVSKPIFHDTLAILALTAIICMALLLAAIIGYMCFLRCKGSCPKCRGVLEQLEKWKSGELKCITKSMVKKRETSISRPTTEFSDVDIEKSVVDDAPIDAQSVHATALCSPDGQIRLWKRIHNIVGMAKEKFASKGKTTVTTQSLHMPSHLRSFTVASSTLCEESPIAPPQVHYASSGCRLYDPISPTHRHSTASTSVYSQTTVKHNPRPFNAQSETAVSMVGLSQRCNEQGPLGHATRDDTWGPRIAAYERTNKIRQAEANLCSPTYKHAEVTMQRRSATDLEMQQAVDIVNQVDQDVSRTRHPSVYSAVD